MNFGPFDDSPEAVAFREERTRQYHAEQDEREAAALADMTDEEKANHKLMLCARELWSATLNGSPGGVERFRWMQDIQPGHTVVEISSWMRNLHAPWTLIGVLESVDDEPILDEGGVQCGTECIFTILSSRGPVRWTNCQFVRVPVSGRDLREIFQRRHA